MDPDDHTKDVKKGSRIIRIPLPNLYVLVLSLRRLTPSEGNTGILRNGKGITRTHDRSFDKIFFSFFSREVGF